MRKYPFDVLFIIRHGQTTWNVQRRHQGRLDSPLTDVGRAQAEAIGTYLSMQSVDHLICSTAGRALTTARIAARDLSLDVMRMESLQEIDQGQWSGLTDSQIERVFPGSKTIRAANKYRWRFPAGESYEDADRRAAKALSVVASLGARRPALVTHEMIGRMLIRNLLDQSVDEGMANRLAHGGILKWTSSAPSLERIDLQVTE